VPPPTGIKTLAHAVPPMPSLDGESRRAQTDTDSSLADGMRETDYITAVEIDHEAKAAAQAAAAAAAANDSADTDDDDDDRVPKRADTDMATGKNPLAGHAIGEVTAVGLAAAPPAPAYHPGDDSEFNRAGSQSEHTAETKLPREGVATPERSQTKTPIPTLERAAQAPPEPERPAQVPISTAPTSLPPPKKIEAVPSGPTPACPQCESPMAWVDEHLRFYCKHCRMYF
jgi:hypothetical protein